MSGVRGSDNRPRNLLASFAIAAKHAPDIVPQDLSKTGSVIAFHNGDAERNDSVVRLRDSIARHHPAGVSRDTSSQLIAGCEGSIPSLAAYDRIVDSLSSSKSGTTNFTDPASRDIAAKLSKNARHAL